MIRLDEAYDPVFIAVFSGRLSDAEAEEYLTWQRAMNERGRENDAPFALIVDASALKGVDTAARHRISAFATAESIPEQSVGTVVIIKSRIIRGVLTALRWVSESARQAEAVADMETARGLVSQRFKERGLLVPAWLERSA